MRKVVGLGLFVSFITLLAMPAFAAPKWDKNPHGFVHGIVVYVDGQSYYFDGPPIEEGAEAKDVPGHTWVQTEEDPYRVVGRHYNRGPFGAPSWWAPDEPNGVLLYLVHGIIASWSMEIGEKMAARGYVHYHELVHTDTGEKHPTLVVWLKHTAVRSFWFASPPMPGAAHEVTPGVDYDFMPNWDDPYDP